MSKSMAQRVVDRAYDHNNSAISFYQHMIIIHVAVAIIFGIIAIVGKREIAWIEAYALPALGYFILAHREAVSENSNILNRSNDSIQKANDQDMIKRNLREEKALKRTEETS